MLAALGHLAGRRVLDAACGPGLYLRELLQRGAEVTAFDASPVRVSLARQRTAGRVRIDQAVLGEPLPYPDGAFDPHRVRAGHSLCQRPGGRLRRVLPGPVPGRGSCDIDAAPGDGLAAPRRLLLPDHPGNRHLAYPIGRPAGALWREPLSALCAAATDAGFLIERLIEPIPAATMREHYPEDYEKLSTEPGFLILRLLKPP